MGWKVARFGELAKVFSGFAFKSTDFRKDSDGIPVIRMSDLKQGSVKIENAQKVIYSDEFKNFLLSEGDFLFGMSGSLSNYGEIKAENLPCLLNQRVGKLIPKNGVNSKFLNYLFTSSSFQKMILDSAAGAAQLNISSKQLEDFEVITPESQSEQKKIAEILTSVDRVIELTSMEIDKLKDLKKGMMQELLTKGIGHTKFKDSPVGKIPESWECGQLDEHVKFSQGVQVDVEEQLSLPKPGYIRFLRIVDYTQSTTDVRYIPEGSAKKGEVELDDVVMVRYGASTGFIGRGLKGAIANNMFTINPKPNVSKEYLYYFLKQDLISQYIANVTAGSAMPAVNFEIVGRITFLLPKSLKEQAEICKNLLALDGLIDIKIKKSVQLLNLKRGLMNDLLTGNKRVV